MEPADAGQPNDQGGSSPMKGAGLKRMTFVIAVCALVGAVAGIAGTAAAPSKKSASSAAAKKKAAAQAKKNAAVRGRAFRRGPGGRGGHGFGPGRPALHSEAVVPQA